MSTSSRETQLSFQARKKAKAQEGADARADYESTQRAIEKKTARLRALRLAKEAVDAAAAKATEKAPAPGKKRRSKLATRP